jgi:hypothetical protein
VNIWSSCLLSCFSTSALLHGFPVVAVSAVVGHPGIVVLLSLFHGFPVVVVSVVAGPRGIVDLTPGFVVLLSLFHGFPVAASLETVVVIAFGVANLGHPTFVASPNVYSFPSFPSFVQLVGGLFVGSSTDALSNGDACRHSSRMEVFLYKKMEHFDSIPNLSCSGVSDTNVLATDATTNHYKRRDPSLCQGRRRHTSQAARPTPVVRQIRLAAADQC